MSLRASIALIAALFLAASPAGAGTSVGGGTSITLVHFFQLVLRKMGYTKEQAESCQPTEHQIERHRAARAGRLPGVGRHENSSDPCAAALDHALELEGNTRSALIQSRGSAPKRLPGAEHETQEPAISSGGVGPPH